MLKIIWHLLIVFFVLIIQHGAAMSTEEPKYTIEVKKDVYEIRKYGPQLVAETLVTGGFADAGNSAFRILADYIFGNNKAKSKIAMTAPVTQAPSEKIAMTAPVTMAKSEGRYLVQFTMPDTLTLANIPEPNDSRVKIRALPERRVAVYKYSGSWSEARYQEKLSLFLAALKRDNLSVTTEPVLARFNSPFQLWFLRRNEIWIELN
jgi:hypothetical protein